MKVITYTCDRCKASDTTNKIDINDVTVTVLYRNNAKMKADWCRKCLNEVGLNESIPEVKRIEPAPTIEDIIREIVRQETK